MHIKASFRGTPEKVTTVELVLHYPGGARLIEAGEFEPVSLDAFLPALHRALADNFPGIGAGKFIKVTNSGHLLYEFQLT